MTVLPGVTISIVTYNTWRRTEECIQSILDFERDQPLEIIVLDNGDPAGRPMQFPQRVIIHDVGANVGFGAGHNENLKRARFDRFLILNPDTTFVEAVLASLMGGLSSEGVVAVAPRLLNSDGSVQQSTRALPTLLTELGRLVGADRTPGRRWSTLIDASMLSGQVSVGQPAGAAIMIRTSDLRQIGGFDEVFPMYFEDVDLCAQLGSTGKISYLADVRIEHDGEGTARKLRAATTFWIEFSRVLYYKKHTRGWRRQLLVAVCRLGCASHWLASEVAARSSRDRTAEFAAKAEGYRVALTSSGRPDVNYWRRRWQMV